MTGIHGSERPSTTIISSRGCPYACRFCCKCHPMYRFFRDRSPELVVSEMRFLRSEYGVEHIRFIDDCFTLKKSLPNLCELLRKEEMTFICITRADHINREMVEGLRMAGCTQVDIGAEYLSDRMLRLMNKQLTVHQITKAIRMLHEAGIGVKVFLMMKYPGETPDDRDKTLRTLRETQPEHFTLSVFQPLEGSAFSENSGYFYPDEDPDRQEYTRQIEAAIRG